MKLTIRLSTALATALFLCATGVSAATPQPGLSYVLTNAKLSLSTVDGSSRLSQSFSTSADYSQNTPPFDLFTPTQLENDDVIRLGFTLGLQEKGKASDDVKLGKEHLPHQAFVVLAESGKGGEAVNAAQNAWTVQVKPSSGKVAWNLRADRIPPHLYEAKNPLVLSLLLSNFPSSSSSNGHYQPLSLPLISLRLPQTQSGTVTSSAREKAEIEQGFRGWPYNRHTFGTSPADTMPRRELSVVAAIVTFVVPWVVLLGLIATVQPSLVVPTTRISLLIVSLVGLEALAIRYWTGMTLFRMLPVLLGGGLVTLIVGKSALGDLRKQRLAAVAK